MKNLSHFATRLIWLKYAPSLVLMLGFQPAFAASIKCETLPFPSVESDVVNSQAKTIALSQINRIIVKSRESSQVLQSIKAESKLSKKSAEQIEEDQMNLQAEKLKEKANWEDEHQLAPAFNKISPHLFDDRFTPLLERRWDYLYNSGLLLRHFDEVWMFLAARDERSANSKFTPGQHLIPYGQKKLIQILKEKLKNATPEQKFAFEEEALETLNISHREPHQLHILDKMSELGYSSENFLFELIELRIRFRLDTAKEPQKGDKAYDVLESYDRTIKMLAHNNLRSPSLGFQDYVLNNRKSFADGPFLLVLSQVKLIDRANDALKEQMFRNKTLDDSLRIAQYFVKFKLYHDDVKFYLNEALRSPDLDAYYERKIKNLLTEMDKS